MKLSDDLVLKARLVAQATERSIAGQIEFWARLGRAIEPMLNSQTVLSLKECADRQLLSSLFATIDQKEGNDRLSAYLAKRPYPHYEAVEGRPELIQRIEASGAHTTGRFINRKFEPVENLEVMAKPVRESPRKAKTKDRQNRASK